MKGFDPLNWIQKKEVKKMGRFIHLAIAAGDFAMEMAGLKVTAEFADRVGVYVSSGIGGFDVIEREHAAATGWRAAQDLALLHPRVHRESGVGPHVDPL